MYTPPSGPTQANVQQQQKNPARKPFLYSVNSVVLLISTLE